MLRAEGMWLMICPHCSVDLKYKERPNRRCSKCTWEFALDPRINRLRMSDLRFRALTEKLSADGSLFYTFPQLYHYMNRKSKAFNPSEVGCLIPLFFIFLFLFLSFCSPLLLSALSSFESLLLGLGILPEVGYLIVIVLLASCVFIWRDNLKSLLQSVTDRFSDFSLLMTPHNFQYGVVNRWQQIYQTAPQGLLNQQELEQLDRFQPAPTQLAAILVCPERAVLDCLHANGIPRRLGVGLLPDKAPFTPAEQITLNALRTQPIPLLLLHDASPAGCLLAHTVRQSLGLDKQQRIIDLAIHPRQAIQYKLMRLRKPPQSGLLSSLKEQTSKLNLQSESPMLSEEELRWLKGGFYSPILALPPARLIKIVTRAVDRLAPMTPAQQAQQRARAVGFMSWPE